MIPVSIFLVGMILLLISTDQLIKITTKLAHSMRLSPLIIGITVVAIGTSLPELIVSTIAAIKHDSGLAVGNVIGSNIVNIFLVLGLGAVSGKLRVGTTKTQKNIIILSLVSFLYLLSFWLNLPGYILAIISLTSVAIFTFVQYRWGVNGRRLEDKILLRFTKPSKLTFYEWLVLIGCLISIFIGGTLIVNSIKQIAVITGYSTNILGLSITAIATSLPEIMATLVGVYRHQDKLLLGNLMGSNIYNILLIGGISSFWLKNYRPPVFEVGAFILSVLIFFGIVNYFQGKIIPKTIGVGLLIFNLIYFLGMYLI